MGKSSGKPYTRVSFRDDILCRNVCKRSGCKHNNIAPNNTPLLLGANFPSCQVECGTVVQCAMKSLQLQLLTFLSLLVVLSFIRLWANAYHCSRMVTSYQFRSQFHSYCRYRMSTFSIQPDIVDTQMHIQIHTSLYGYSCYLRYVWCAQCKIPAKCFQS